jgi:hypothetical protein
MIIRILDRPIFILMIFIPTLLIAAEEAPDSSKQKAPVGYAANIRDAVYLKNGSIIRGSVVEMIPDSVVRLLTSDGSLFVFPMKEVEKIVKEETPVVRPTGLPIQPSEVRSSKTHIGPVIGYGAKDWFGVGFGLRIGTTFSRGTYFGGIFVYHLGKPQQMSFYSGYGYYSFNYKLNTLYLGPEIGHDIRATDNFVVRPYISFGYLSLMASVEGGGSSGSDSKGYFYFSPGLMLNVVASERATIGLDGRYVIVAGEDMSDANAPGIFLSIAFTP